MTELSRYTTPEERAIGCTFADCFHSETLCNSNGGYSTGGNPVVFSGPKSGASFDGADSYLQYQLVADGATAHPFDSTDLSIVMEFVPHFTVTGSTQYMFCKSNSLAYAFYVSGAGALSLRMGSTAVMTIASASWTPYWVQDGRNVITSSCSTGDCNFWINGQKILDASAAPWSPNTTMDTWNIGAGPNGLNDSQFDVQCFKVFSSRLTEADHLNYLRPAS